MLSSTFAGPFKKSLLPLGTSNAAFVSKKWCSFLGVACFLGACDEGHDVQLVHGAHVLQEPACKPLISLDQFLPSPVVELTYIFHEVRLNPEKLHMGFLSVEFRGNDPPQYDEALYDCHRRTVEWAVLAQAAREPAQLWEPCYRSLSAGIKLQYCMPQS